ncbi:serine acetyltransferase [bacterium]|nr:serine acetyltransferase [bacterium]
MTNDDRSRQLRRLTSDVVDTFRTVGGINRIGEKNLPSQAAVVAILDELQAVVFPGYHGDPIPENADLEVLVGARLDAVARNLSAVIERTLRFCRQLDCRCEELWQTTGTADLGEARFREAAEVITLRYLAQLPEIRRLLALDVRAAFEGDPAAQNPEEVILCYPGITAITIHRLAHPLQKLGVPLVPRMMSEWAHHRSGADINPGAVIGRRFFIDHGTGVVIGETTRIGNEVKVYQGVTLGALSFRRNPDGTLVKGGKRHPTIGDRVTIYANATILGGETEIGAGAVIGGGAWITASVAPGEKILAAGEGGAIRP